MPSATVTFNGRVTLPTHVIKELGLKTGDTVEFVQTEKGRFSIFAGPEAIDSSRTWARRDRDPDREVLDEVLQ